MGFQSLYTAATGMQAMETKLDVIANNLANNSTTAFKKDRANFEDLLYRQHNLPGSRDQDGNITATGIEVGLGVRVSSTQSDFDQGSLQQTGNPLDVAIEGPGFFEVQTANGEQYTRAGNFNVNADGELVLGSANLGFRLNPTVSIPQEALDVSISSDGQVFVRLPNTEGLSSVGQLQLASFRNPDGLLKLGDNLFAETDASGPATLGIPGDQGLGALASGALEASNVDATTELIDLINTQRSFELNSQVIRAGDEIMELVANLRR